MLFELMFVEMRINPGSQLLQFFEVLWCTGKSNLVLDVVLQTQVKLVAECWIIPFYVLLLCFKPRGVLCHRGQLFERAKLLFSRSGLIRITIQLFEGGLEGFVRLELGRSGFSGSAGRPDCHQGLEPVESRSFQVGSDVDNLVPVAGKS